jgi:DNA-binding GntR family transcriptional regulator
MSTADRSGRKSGRQISPVVQESTPSLIARQLRVAITSGAIPSGAQMIEADLAQDLGVSRGPLREAMQRLTQEGLLQSIRNRGLFVVTLTAADAQDVYFARSSIERAAAARIIQRGPVETDLKRLRQRVEAIAAAGDDVTAGTLADLQFHKELVALAASTRLVRMEATLLTETQICLRSIAPSYASDPWHRAEEHAALVDMIARGDVPGVNRLIDGHAHDALQRMQLAETHP